MRHGDKVRIATAVGGADQGRRIERQDATVLGVNAEFVSGQDGKTPMVNVQLEDGAMVAVPVAAVSKRRK